MPLRTHSIRHSRPLRLALIAGAASLAATGVAFAQDDATEVGEVVVTARHYVPTENVSATKTQVPLVETPASITVITRDQIDVLSMQNLQQAVRYTAGAVGESFGVDSRFDWLTIRGFQPVEFIDGFRAPVGSTPTVGLDTWGADSIEVLKGPAGVLYGATPPGGIVNFTSRRPTADRHGEVQVMGGTYSNVQAAADVTGAFTEGSNVYGRLTALWRQSDTQINGADVQRLYIAPAMTWAINDKASFTLLSFYQKDNNHGGDGGFLPAAGTLLPNPNGRISPSTNVGEPGYNFFNRELYGVGYEYSHAFTDSLTFVQNFKYTRQNENFTSIYGQGLQSDNRTLNRANFIFPEDIKNTGVDTRLQWKGATGSLQHTALVGVDYLDVRNDTDFIFGAAPSIDIFHPVYGQAIPAPFYVDHNYIHTDSKQTGVYAQDSIKVGNWRFTGNLRQDWLRGPVHDDAFTWRAGVNYLFDSGLAPYLAYSTSFQPVGGADFGGNAFKPTEGDQVEAGIKFEPRHMPRYIKWYASAAIFSLTQDNVLVSDPNHAFFSVQTGEIKVKGVELESVARIRERLTINAAYSYTDTDDAIPAIPKSKASLLVDYTFQDGPVAGLGGGFGARYLGESTGATGLKSDSATVVDALAHYDHDNWRFSLNATNLFDKVFVQSCSDSATCFYNQGRTVTASIGRKW